MSRSQEVIPLAPIASAESCADKESSDSLVSLRRTLPFEVSIMTQSGLETGLSPAATTVAFDQSVPPARVPVPAAPADNPERGPFLLAFLDDDTCHKSWSHSELLFDERCEVGARMGCSRAALRKCQPRWWQRLLAAGRDREAGGECQQDCEEREISACLATASMECHQMAADYCGSVYHKLLVANQPDLVPSHLKSRKAPKKSLTNLRTYKCKSEQGTHDDIGEISASGDDGSYTSRGRSIDSMKTNVHFPQKLDLRKFSDSKGLRERVPFDAGSAQRSVRGGYVGGWIEPKKYDGFQEGEVLKVDRAGDHTPPTSK